MKLLSRVRLFATPWTAAHQASPSMEFSRQEYWSGLPFPSPGDLPDPGIEPRSPALEADALSSELTGKPHNILKQCQLSKKRSKRWTWEISAPETDLIPLSVPCSNIWLSTTFSGKGKKKKKGTCTSKGQIWCKFSLFQLPNYVILVIIHTAFWASLEGRKEEGREVFAVALW